MKVAHVLLRFDAPGGVETNVREVTRRLRAAGEDVEVFASDLYDEGRWERRSDYAPVVDGVPVHRFPVRKRLVPGLTMPMMVGLIDALAEAIGRVWEDRDLARRLGEYGRDQVIPRFQWDRLADRLDAIYREVTSR